MHRPSRRAVPYCIGIPTHETRVFLFGYTYSYTHDLDHYVYFNISILFHQVPPIILLVLFLYYIILYTTDTLLTTTLNFYTFPFPCTYLLFVTFLDSF